MCRTIFYIQQILFSKHQLPPASAGLISKHQLPSEGIKFLFSKHPLPPASEGLFSKYQLPPALAGGIKLVWFLMALAKQQSFWLKPILH
jgi:hypothetical protein